MGQLRRPQPSDRETVLELKRQLDENDECLVGPDGNRVLFEKGSEESGLWRLTGTRPGGQTLDGRVDPSTLFAWLHMHGVSYDSTIGLFDEYPPDNQGVIAPTNM